MQKDIVTIASFDWNNYKVLSKNRKPSRVHFFPYADEQSAITYNWTNSSRLTILNGMWDFQWYPSPLDVDYENLLNLRGDRQIPVPSQWQFHGYGKFVYTDMWYDFPVDAPFVSIHNNETGVYHRTFQVHDVANFLSIRFEGVESSFHLYINGKEVGYSQGSRNPSEFDISSYIKVGENHIHVVVYQNCDGSYLEAQDMWWLGGIIRDVYLIERRPVSINNLILDPDYDIARSEGVLNTNIMLNGEGSISCKLYDHDGFLHEFTLSDGVQTIRLPNITPWNAEQPYLYKLLFIVKDTEGNVEEVVPQQIGFRHIAIVEGVLKLNGKRIFLRGVNRHEYSAKTGRVISYEETLKELILIKQHSMNAIRTSHYPNNPFFYDICDEIGLYVIDEADLESHGLEPIAQETLLCDNPKYEDMYVERIERLVERDRNHASVIMWSLGNESAYGVNFQSMYTWCKEHEPSRPVHYEGDHQSKSVDVSSSMYSTIDKLKILDADTSIKKPHVLCEFCHAMGNGPGSLKEYYDVIEQSRRIQAMFVWEFKDQGVYKDGRFLYGGDFGESFHNGNFCMDGLVMSDNTLTPAFNEYAKVIEPIYIESFDRKNRTILIKNRFDFLQTDNMLIRYKLIEDCRVINTIEENMPVIKAQQKLSIRLPPELFESFDNCNYYVQIEFLYATYPSVWMESCTLGTEVFLVHEAIPSVIHLEEKLSVRDVVSNLWVEGQDFSIAISKKDGSISAMNYQGVPILEHGPRINFFRPYTDNDLSSKENWSAHHLHAMEMNVYSLGYEKKKGSIVIKVEGRVGARGLSWGSKVVILYTISQGGYVNISLEGSFSQDAPSYVPKIGLQLLVNKEFSSVTYEGYGPGECYSDSKEYAVKGIHSMPCNQMSFPYLTPQENGNRTEVTWASLMHKNQKLFFQLSASEMDFSIRDVTDMELYKKNHIDELETAPYLIVNCDMINSGLGSQSCGPDRLEKYQAQTKKNYSFLLKMRPVSVELSKDNMKKQKYEIEEARNLWEIKV